MDKAPTPHRWFPTWRTPSTPPESDAADLGTAFGLDLSLGEMAHATLQPPTPARQAGWMSRLAKRRKPSTA